MFKTKGVRDQVYVALEQGFGRLSTESGYCRVNENMPESPPLFGHSPALTCVKVPLTRIPEIVPENISVPPCPFIPLPLNDQIPVLAL